MSTFLFGIFYTCATMSAVAMSGATMSAVAGLAEDHSNDWARGALFAQRVEDLLAVTKETNYQHTTSIDEKKGIVRCDCSGLIGFVLRHEYPEAYVCLRGKQAQWRRRPLAVTFYETFLAAGQNAKALGASQTGLSQAGPWQQVVRMKDVVPGDIVAWRKQKLKQGSTTGHVCMVAGYPTELESGHVRVRIIDSTRNSERSGFGSGFKTFLVNEVGEPIGYINGTRITKLQVAAGRLAESTTTEVGSEEADFVGMDVAQAIVLAKDRNLTARIIRQDNEAELVPWKIKPTRLNFIVRHGKVIRVIRG